MVKRVITGILLAILLFAMLYLGSIAETVVFTLAGLWAVHEMTLLLKRKELYPFVLPAYGFALLLGAWQYFLPAIDWTLLWLFFIFVVMAELIFNNRRKIQDGLASFMLFIYPLPFIAILLQTGLALGASALLLAFACPLFGDIAGFLIGTAIGKRPLCPEISPKKTIEGSVASVFGGVLGGLFTYFMQPLIGVTELESVLPFIFIGLCCGVAGQIGDLFASRLKRWADIKDFSDIFPGHGGLLDRVDSVLLCAPVVYFGFYLAMGV